jgi:hypothetical protein
LDGIRREEIIELHAAGMSPTGIQRFLLGKNLFLNTTQISTLVKRETTKQFVDESQELIRWVGEHGGVTHTFTQWVDEQEYVVAIFTQFREELESMHQWPDVVFLDGTHPQTNLKWEVVPITVINGNRNVECAGIAFVAHFTTDVIVWLLKLIWGDEVMQQRWRMLITDEDSAIIPALEIFRRECGVPDDFTHRLCAMHKKNNFLMKAARAGLSKTSIGILRTLYDQMVYSDHAGIADEAASKLLNIQNLKLLKYCKEHVLDLRNAISRLPCTEFFSCGYLTSSPAESMNRMLKRGMPSHSHSLTQARIYFCQRLANHCSVVRNKERSEQRYQHQAVKFSGVRDVEIFYDVTLRPNVRKVFLDEFERMKEASSKELWTKDGVRCWGVQEKNGVVYSVVVNADGNASCQCGQVDFAGWPCSHLLFLASQERIVLAPKYFHPRWLNVDTGECVHDPDPPAVLDEGEKNEEEEEEENVACLNDQAVVSRDDFLNPEIDFPHLSARARFLALINEATAYCSVASQSAEASTAAVRVIRQALARLTGEEGGGVLDEHAPAEPGGIGGVAPIVLPNAVGRPRGRPPRVQQRPGRPAARNRNQEVLDHRPCMLCGEGHELKDCPGFGMVVAAREENEGAERIGRQKLCKLCLGYGHQTSHCQVRARFLARE